MHVPLLVDDFLFQFLAPAAPVSVKVDQQGLVFGLGPLEGFGPIVFKFNTLGKGGGTQYGRKQGG